MRICSLRMAAAFLSLAAGLPAQTSTPSDERDVSWKKMVPNILEDQKEIWTFPVRLVRPNDLAPTAAVVGVGSALILLADPPEAHYFRNTNGFHTFNTIFSSNATTVGTLLVPASFLMVGIVKKDDKAKKTALFSAEALADVEIVSTVFKQATDRSRPIDIPARSSFGDSWSEGASRFVKNGGSFPSGHTIAAFAVATVISRRYPHHRWVPLVAYGAAAAVGFSRLSLSAHFASDVFVGGVLGYSIARFSVLRQ